MLRLASAQICQSVCEKFPSLCQFAINCGRCRLLPILISLGWAADAHSIDAAHAQGIPLEDLITDRLEIASRRGDCLLFDQAYQERLRTVWCLVSLSHYAAIAAYYGHLRMLQHLSTLEQPRWKGTRAKIPLDEKVCTAAARGGHLSILQWLRNSYRFRPRDVWNYERDFLEYCPWNEETCEAAVRSHHTHVLEWLCSNGCPWWGNTYQNASLSVQLLLLSATNRAGYHFPDTFESFALLAVTQGRLKVLQWLHSKGLRLQSIYCSLAARGGQLEILKWLRSRSCDWDECVPMNAVHNGHLDTFRWAVQNGCPYDVQELLLVTEASLWPEIVSFLFPDSSFEVHKMPGRLPFMRVNS